MEVILCSYNGDDPCCYVIPSVLPVVFLIRQRLSCVVMVITPFARLFLVSYLVF